MEIIEKAIEVNSPLSTVYNQWTQFEIFPEFMDSVEEVRQMDVKQLHWKVKISGKVKEWNAEIYQQEPDSLIAWQTISGPVQNGTVSFRTRGPSRTEVMVRIEYQPDNLVERLAGSLGILGRRIGEDLEQFKEFIENRPAETGAWRGRIRGADVV